MKIDHEELIGAYTAVHGEFSVVEVPPLDHLMIDGHGDPDTSPAHRDAIASIYPLAYALRSLSKRELGRDYVVMPREALWWSEEMASSTSGRDESRWDWTLLDLVPDWITQEHVASARDAAAGRRGGAPLADVRLERHEEGLSVQTLHIGPYDDEAPVLQAMHEEFIPAQSLRMTGRHHEIYLSDARRTPPHRLRTMLRQPVERSSDHRGAGQAPESGHQEDGLSPRG